MVAETKNSDTNKRRNIVLVTGSRHSGKTTLVSKFVAGAVQRGLRIAGILAPGEFTQGVRNSFSIIDIARDRAVPLATRNTSDDAGSIPFDFHDEGLIAGYRALAPDSCRRRDIVVVDEVGRLELNNRGWSSHLSPLLDLPQKITHIWVVRREFLPPVCAKWGIEPQVIIDTEEKDALQKLEHIFFTDRQHCS